MFRAAAHLPTQVVPPSVLRYWDPQVLASSGQYSLPSLPPCLPLSDFRPVHHHTTSSGAPVPCRPPTVLLLPLNSSPGQVQLLWLLASRPAALLRRSHPSPPGTLDLLDLPPSPPTPRKHGLCPSQPRSQASLQDTPDVRGAVRPCSPLSSTSFLLDLLPQTTRKLPFPPLQPTSP